MPSLIDSLSISTTPSLSDPILTPFRTPSFDPASYLNATLPPLRTPSSRGPFSPDSTTLTDLTTNAQSLISRLSTQLNLLSASLTTLTDAILRSGPRLAYAVDLLRGETASLTETLIQSLRAEIQHFVPDGLHLHLAASGPDTVAEGAAGHEREPKAQEQLSAQEQQQQQEHEQEPQQDELSPLSQLRTLALVRSRLDSVLRVFDAALAWPLPPSALASSSTTSALPSSLFSVSAPADATAESHASQQSREDRGREYMRRVREEIARLESGGDVDAARRRVRELGELARVWAGTGEEKARREFVESLSGVGEGRY